VLKAVGRHYMMIAVYRDFSIFEVSAIMGWIPYKHDCFIYSHHESNYIAKQSARRTNLVSHHFHCPR